VKGLLKMKRDKIKEKGKEVKLEERDYTLGTHGGWRPILKNIVMYMGGKG